MLTRSNIRLDDLLLRLRHKCSSYLRVLYDLPNVFKTIVQDFITQAGDDSVANDEHGVVMPTENKSCVSGDVVETVHVVERSLLACVAQKCLHVRKRPLVLAGAKNRSVPETTG